VIRPPISVMRGFCLSESRPGPAGRTAARQSFDQLATESPYFQLVALVALVTFVGSTYGETLPAAPAADRAALFTAAHAETPLLRSLAATGAAHPAPAALTCCKGRSAGDACGNTCISRDETCHVGPGCA
jgi:hypothetical protein